MEARVLLQNVTKHLIDLNIKLRYKYNEAQGNGEYEKVEELENQSKILRQTFKDVYYLISEIEEEETMRKKLKVFREKILEQNKCGLNTNTKF